MTQTTNITVIYEAEQRLHLFKCILCSMYINNELRLVFDFLKHIQIQNIKQNANIENLKIQYLFLTS